MLKFVDKMECVYKSINLVLIGKIVIKFYINWYILIL